MCHFFLSNLAPSECTRTQFENIWVGLRKHKCKGTQYCPLCIVYLSVYVMYNEPNENICLFFLYLHRSGTRRTNVAINMCRYNRIRTKMEHLFYSWKSTQGNIIIKAYLDSRIWSVVNFLSQGYSFYLEFKLVPQIGFRIACVKNLDGPTFFTQIIII